MHKSFYAYIRDRQVHRHSSTLSTANIQFILFRELVAKHRPYTLINFIECHNVRVIIPSQGELDSDGTLSDPE
jgi:hypothetical protein